MKTTLSTILICLLIGMQAVAANGRRHIFTDTDGRRIEAKLLQYDDATGRVRIETTDGRQVWVYPSDFAGDSETYIRRWIEVERILSDRYLGLDVDKRLRGDSVQYELIMENRARSPLPSMKVAYVIYIKRNGRNGGEDTIRSLGSTFQVDHVDPIGKTTYATKRVALKKQFSPPKGYVEDEPMGVWFRIYGPPLDGVPSERNICFPNGLMNNVDWADHLFSTEEEGLLMGDDPSTDLDSVTQELESIMDVGTVPEPDAMLSP